MDLDVFGVGRGKTVKIVPRCSSQILEAATRTNVFRASRFHTKSEPRRKWIVNRSLGQVLRDCLGLLYHIQIIRVVLLVPRVVCALYTNINPPQQIAAEASLCVLWVVVLEPRKLETT